MFRSYCVRMGNCPRLFQRCSPQTFCPPVPDFIRFSVTLRNIGLILQHSRSLLYWRSISVSALRSGHMGQPAFSPPFAPRCITYLVRNGRERNNQKMEKVLFLDKMSKNEGIYCRFCGEKRASYNPARSAQIVRKRFKSAKTPWPKAILI